MLNNSPNLVNTLLFGDKFSRQSLEKSLAETEKALVNAGPEITAVTQHSSLKCFKPLIRRFKVAVLLNI